jgi:uridine nucleosidase
VKIIFDTDPGIDDSMALLLALASPELEVVGVTTVFGNNSVDKLTLNALRILEVAGRSDIPVAQGAGTPLVRAYRGRGEDVHGEDGLGNTNLPLPAGKALAESAAAFIVRTVCAQPGEITLVAVGPLTNLALALKLEPRLPTLVKQVIVRGGAAHVPGNISPVAEANIYNDPEAANLVFSARWPLTMVGLDVTTRTVMTRAYFDSVLAVRNPRTEFLEQVTPFYFKFYAWLYKLDGVFTHDPSAIGYAIDPTLFQTENVPIYVETQGNCAGQTVPDPFRSYATGGEVTVCVGVDSERLLALFKERLTQP